MSSLKQPVRISLFAPHGRMGKAIAQAAAEEAGFILDEHEPDVLIDFSAPAALEGSVAMAIAANIPILVGTTGLGPAEEQLTIAAARQIALLRAANTSLGVAILADLVERAASSLGPGWDIEITDTHHRMKTDAPSGTALTLAEAASRGLRRELEKEEARSGTGLKRTNGAIGFASLRGGTVAGDHDVMFLGPDERLVLSHRAENRMIFARGALAAARFLVGKPAGYYSMRDVVAADRA